MGRLTGQVDELVEHWTVLEDEQQLVAGKRGATSLGFALLLKFYMRPGRFPRGRSELPQGSDSDPSGVEVVDGGHSTTLIKVRRVGWETPRPIHTDRF